MVCRDKPNEPCVWTNGDGLWIRGAIRGLTFPARRRGPAALPFGPLEETRVDARSDCNAVP
jgi:hypothetical protein